MAWVEQELKDRKRLAVSPERAALLNETKKEVHPIIVQEAARGDKPFEPLKFQPVKSPGLFEAEFAKKESDLIFHFWPWGLHDADRNGTPRPPFSVQFRNYMPLALYEIFDKKFVEIIEDRDMGSFYVKVKGFGGKQFWFDLCVKAVTGLHHRLGGE